MIVLLQRVLEAQVVRRAEGGQAEEPLGAVGRGLLAFVCAEPGDSAIDRILKLIEEAEERRAPSDR
jgi:D-Tyr-tRNAtyr deacylase